MKKNIFIIGAFAITILVAFVACKESDKDSKNAGDKQTSTVTTDKESSNHLKNGSRIVKRITQDNQGKLVSYIRFVYNNANKLDSVNTYSDNNIQNEYIAFTYNNTGNVDHLQYADGGDITNVSFLYKNDLITHAQKASGTSKTADYTLSYDNNNTLVKVDMTDNASGSNMTNIISYNTDGKVNQQTNPFFTGGIPTGSGFLIGSDGVDSIKYLEYYPQSIKSLAPPLDNLIVKYYTKKAQIGTDIFFFETTFNESGNPTKTIKKLNDSNGSIQSITLYEYE